MLTCQDNSHVDTHGLAVRAAGKWRAAVCDDGRTDTRRRIPTLLVFILAQNTIMKGIILPSFK